MKNKELSNIYKVCCEVSEVDISLPVRTTEDYVYGRACYYVISKKIIGTRYVKKYDTTITVQKYSDQKIAKYIGRTHAAAINARRKVKYEYNLYPEFITMYNKCLELLGIKETETIDNRIESLQKENKELIDKIKSLEIKSDFLNEINELPSNLKQEFEKYKWLPFKKMQESREHYKMNVEHKPVY